MHKTQVIILRGRKQSGKSFSCDFISSKLEGAYTYSFATPLKNFCINVLGIPYKQVYGTDEEKNLPTHIIWSSLPFTLSEILELRRKCVAKHEHMMSGREVLQVFGTNICRRLYGDCWVNATVADIVKDHPAYALIADARFPNEIEFFNNIKNGPWAEHFTEDPIVISLLRNPLNDQHESEVALDGYDFKAFKRFHQLDNSDMSIEDKNMFIEDILYVELPNSKIAQNIDRNFEISNKWLSDNIDEIRKKSMGIINPLTLSDISKVEGSTPS